MRNLILVFAVLFIFSSCNKDNNRNSKGIIIKGKISGLTTPLQ